MALLPSESPAVTVREVDLSGVVPAVTSSTGAIVGDFNWGPANKPILIGNEAELTSQFGSPTLVVDSDNTDFLSAAAFLKYSGTLYVTRGLDATATNAVDSDAAGLTNQPGSGESDPIGNLDDWQNSSFVNDINRIVAKYPGLAGNSLSVSICPYSETDAAFGSWAYKSFFDGAPGTSSYVEARSTDSALAHDEIHVAVIDEGGKFTGTPGSVLETWSYLSLATDAKTPDGTNNFALDVLSDKSQYIWASAIDTGRPTNLSASEFLTASVTDNTVRTQSFNGGNQTSGTLSLAEYLVGFDQFEDEDTIQIDFLIAPKMATNTDQTSLVADLVSTAQLRKDCVVVTSPAKESIVNVSDPDQIKTNVVAFANGLASSSYLIVDNNFLKVYDKYNDEYVFIPAASSTAGLMAAGDFSSAPWYSPAGNRRGQYFGVSSLAWNATKSQRDTLYKAGVNPIVNLPGQGILLFGDKTKLGRPSAFDRINVRRLFLVMERSIKAAAQNVMFEFNDEFTRAEFVNIVEPFLREIKGRRGITDFRVVCDETNNTANVIDNNQFIADIFVKPARSINYVTLSFVAVRTGVDFEEVVGLV